MAMHDRNDYLNQILARVGEIGKLAHEHSYAFDAVHACLPRFVTLNNHMPVGRLTADPIDHTCITKAKPIGGRPAG